MALEDDKSQGAGRMAGPASSLRTVFAGGEVFDGTAAEPCAADVAVQDGRIVDVGSGLDGDRQVDCTGRTVMPGLIDCHVHVTVTSPDLSTRLQQPFSYEFFEAVVNLRRTLEAGITSVRDAGGADLGVKRAVKDGLISGPRMQIAVSLISQTGGHDDGMSPSGYDVPLCRPHPGRPHAVADGPDELRKVSRTLLRAGADVLKVCTTGGVLSPGDNPRHSQFSVAELQVVVAEAQAQGRCVMAHAQGRDGIKNAIRAGARSIEHGIFLDDEAIAMMIDRGVFLVPTLIAPHWILQSAAAGVSYSESVLAKAREMTSVHAESVRHAAAAGVRIAMGTDAGVGPHGSNLDELPLMAAAGMSPHQVLTSATSEAAALLGWEHEVGRIRPGLWADLLVVNGSPLDLDELPNRIAAVVKGGETVLDRMP